LLITINTTNFIIILYRCTATRSTCGPPQAIKTDKNQSYICSISYGRSDWDFNLCCYKCMSV